MISIPLGIAVFAIVSTATVYLCRLLLFRPVQEEVGNTNDTFKVGDTVRIRAWGDMAAEFGVNKEYGGEYIKGPNGAYFHDGMKKLCSRKCTIVGIHDSYSSGPYYSLQPSSNGFYIYEWMLEHTSSHSPSVNVTAKDLSGLF